ncbi:hypothetical protein VITU102760_04050 [Vibrio tubiashii]|uniref:MFS transporter n=1 Tax=Vibrio tubiashii ATCC 19109 TaxID=1051646 RepID=F9T515_9VIBR|nr:hypothetical protein [Vibrio tubiashii]AIW16713.1 MFS transporter [Vibrio tubiashii ATCC 19109]EGU55502.1 major facilitator superfamily protein [Vibrio tubiashii ATCC 19109]EIF02059.1 major facilitator superfamily protein [Vibrio tubiashii NCIMB 1337 = ATCC 19106]
MPYWLSASFKLAIAASVFSILPSYLNAIAQHFALSSKLVNALATVELMGFAVACGLNVLLLRKGVAFNDRIVLCLLCFCNLASAYITALPLFFLVRGLAGICAGLVIVRCYEVLSADKHPDAAFGRAIAIQMTATAGMFLLLPFLIEGTDSSVMFIALGALVGLTSLQSSLPSFSAGEEQKDIDVDYNTVFISLSAIAMVILTHSAVWSTLGSAASKHHITLDEQGLLFSVGTLFSIGGAMLATLAPVYSRKKWILPFAIGLQCLVVSLMLTGQERYIFTIATFFFQLLWNLIVPLVMGTIVSGKNGGVVVRYTLAAQTFGAALGPMILVPGWVLPEMLIALLITYLLVSSSMVLNKA